MSSPKINLGGTRQKCFHLIGDWSLGGLAIWISSGGRFDRDVDS